MLFQVKRASSKWLCMLAKSLQWCLPLWDTIDCSLPGSSVHEILQARILESVAMSSSRRILQGIFPTQRANPCLLYLLHWQVGRWFFIFCFVLFFYHWCHPGSWVLCSSIDMTFSGTIRIDLENRFMVAGAWGWECYARCPNPRAGREKASKTMQLAKRELYCWLESGLLPHSTQWFGVREPRAQAVTQIYRVSISSW